MIDLTLIISFELTEAIIWNGDERQQPFHKRLNQQQQRKRSKKNLENAMENMFASKKEMDWSHELIHHYLDICLMFAKPTKSCYQFLIQSVGLSWKSDSPAGPGVKQSKSSISVSLWTQTHRATRLTHTVTLTSPLVLHTPPPCPPLSLIYVVKAALKGQVLKCSDSVLGHLRLHY